ncbi:hypothetical protein HQ602_18655 [Rhodococcus kroppenstedtii]|uniref:hypothetical protein n=1 Tax=Rhodococcoides kroppenstedtii TaxID=293050 RepID=UPI001C9B2ACF|nr:hypothetical protein [Rhodococcus kroppenstedtii]MBY6438397.1 hypothetical protein [Rhodococcus kroppenstedtii]
MTARATAELARINNGRALPVAWGEFAVRPTPEVRRTRITAAVVSVVGAWTVAGALWNAENAAWMIALAFGILAAATYLPRLLVTMQHNREVE